MAVVPALTPSGSVAPKLSLTLSPSSSTAVNVKDLEVSPLSKVTFCGTPE